MVVDHPVVHICRSTGQGEDIRHDVPPVILVLFVLEDESHQVEPDKFKRFDGLEERFYAEITIVFTKRNCCC